MDLKVFYACISKLEIMFPDFEIYTMPELTESEQFNKRIKIDTWQENFKNIDDQVFVQACTELINTHKFKDVSVANLMDQIKLIQKDEVSSSDEAWQQVLDSFRNFHPTIEYSEAKASYSEDVRAIVKDLGGFTRLSMKTSKELAFVEREFKAKYNERMSTSIRKKNSSQVKFLENNATKMIEG